MLFQKMEGEKTQGANVKHSNLERFGGPSAAMEETHGSAIQSAALPRALSGNHVDPANMVLGQNEGSFLRGGGQQEAPRPALPRPLTPAQQHHPGAQVYYHQDNLYRRFNQHYGQHERRDPAQSEQHGSETSKRVDHPSSRPEYPEGHFERAAQNDIKYWTEYYRYCYDYEKENIWKGNDSAAYYNGFHSFWEGYRNMDQYYRQQHPRRSNTYGDWWHYDPWYTKRQPDRHYGDQYDRHSSQSGYATHSTPSSHSYHSGHGRLGSGPRQSLGSSSQQQHPDYSTRRPSMVSPGHSDRDHHHAEKNDMAQGSTSGYSTERERSPEQQALPRPLTPAQQHHPGAQVYYHQDNLYRRFNQHYGQHERRDPAQSEQHGSETSKRVDHPSSRPEYPEGHFERAAQNDIKYWTEYYRYCYDYEKENIWKGNDSAAYYNGFHSFWEGYRNMDQYYRQQHPRRSNTYGDWWHYDPWYTKRQPDRHYGDQYDRHSSQSGYATHSTPSSHSYHSGHGRLGSGPRQSLGSSSQQQHPDYSTRRPSMVSPGHSDRDHHHAEKNDMAQGSTSGYSTERERSPEQQALPRPLTPAQQHHPGAQVYYHQDYLYRRFNQHYGQHERRDPAQSEQHGSETSKLVDHPSSRPEYPEGHFERAAQNDIKYWTEYYRYCYDYEKENIWKGNDSAAYYNGFHSFWEGYRNTDQYYRQQHPKRSNTYGDWWHYDPWYTKRQPDRHYGDQYDRHSSQSGYATHSMPSSHSYHSGHGRLGSGPRQSLGSSSQQQHPDYSTRRPSMVSPGHSDRDHHHAEKNDMAQGSTSGYSTERERSPEQQALPRPLTPAQQHHPGAQVYYHQDYLYRRFNQHYGQHERRDPAQSEQHGSETGKRVDHPSSRPEYPEGHFERAAQNDIKYWTEYYRYCYDYEKENIWKGNDSAAYYNGFHSFWEGYRNMDQYYRQQHPRRSNTYGDWWHYDPWYTKRQPDRHYGDQYDRHSSQSGYATHSYHSGHGRLGSDPRQSLGSSSQQQHPDYSTRRPSMVSPGHSDRDHHHAEKNNMAQGSTSGYSTERERSPEQQALPRPLTPEQFSVPHSQASVVPDGQLPQVQPKLPSGGQPALLQTHGTEVTQQDIWNQAFPGPLVKDETLKEEVIKFTQKKSMECLANDSLTDKTSAHLCWEYMGLLCRQNGEVSGPDVARLLLAGHKSLTAETFRTTLEDSGKETELFREMLMLGRTKDFCDEKWADWRPHLAMILSNPTDSKDLQQQTITTMGDTLASKGRIDAAHFCYMVAGVELSLYNKRSKMVLIGADHSLPFKTFASNEAIQRTEVYEYAQSLNSVCLPKFQIFKYVYAGRLAEAGLAAQALQYCEGVAKAVLASPSDIKTNTLVSQLIELSAKLWHSDPLRERPERKFLPEPDWLVSLRKLGSKIKERTPPASAGVVSELQGVCNRVDSGLQGGTLDLADGPECCPSQLPLITAPPEIPPAPLATLCDMTQVLPVVNKIELRVPPTKSSQSLDIVQKTQAPVVPDQKAVCTTALMDKSKLMPPPPTGPQNMTSVGLRGPCGPPSGASLFNMYQRAGPMKTYVDVMNVGGTKSKPGASHPSPEDMFAPLAQIHTNLVVPGPGLLAGLADPFPPAQPTAAVGGAGPGVLEQNYPS